MRVTRRQVLVSGAALAAVVGVGALAWLPAPAEGWRVLSVGEADAVRSLAEALFPPDNTLGIDGGQVDIAPAVDELLGDQLDEKVAPVFRYVLRALEDTTLAARGASFGALPLADRVDVLRHWDNENLYARRAAYDVLRLVLGMAFFNLPQVTARVGWRSRCTVGSS